MFNTARFNDFHELQSRRPSVGCVRSPDHKIKRGDLIGWSRKHRVACCAACWESWVGENASADFDEQQYASQY